MGKANHEGASRHCSTLWKSDFDLPLNLHLALMAMSGLALGQTLQPKLQIACGQDDYKHHSRVL